MKISTLVLVTLVALGSGFSGSALADRDRGWGHNDHRRHYGHRQDHGRRHYGHDYRRHRHGHKHRRGHKHRHGGRYYYAPYWADYWYRPRHHGSGYGIQLFYYDD